MPNYIVPKISAEEAKNILCAPPGLLKKKRVIERVELFYLPSYIIEMRVRGAAESVTQSLCLDAVLGSFAFFQAAEITEKTPADFLTCPFFLPEEQIRALALENYRRYLLRNNLQLRKNFQVEKIQNARQVYYPFWLGYFKRRGKIDFDAVDAVGGEHQGVALRPVFMKALVGESRS